MESLNNRQLRADLEAAAQVRDQTRHAARTARRTLRQIRRRHRRAAMGSWVRRTAPRARVAAMCGFATCALVFFVLGVNLYFTGRPGSGDSFKGAGAAAGITAMVRRRADSTPAGDAPNRPTGT